MMSMFRKSIPAALLLVAFILTIWVLCVAERARAASGDVWAVGRTPGVDDVRVNSSGNLLVANNATISGTLTAGGVTTTYQPAADATSNLGASGKQWKSFYMAGTLYDVGNAFTFPSSAGMFAVVKASGSATLTSGVATVSTSAVAAGARILVTGQGTGACWVKHRVNSTSFDIYSTDGDDVGPVDWVIVPSQ